MTAQTLIAGVGSPHGDDQIGWLAAERLAAAVPSYVAVRAAVHPLDLLDWLDDVERLIVVDACQAGDSPVGIHRWRWPSDEIACLQSSGTHDFSLPHVLQLAGQLDRLPPEVVVFGVEVKLCDPGSGYSAEMGRRVDEVVERLLDEVDPTRQSACGLGE